MENLKIFTSEEFGNIGVIVKNNKEFTYKGYKFLEG